MKTRNLLPLLLAGSMIVACGEVLDANDATLDAENGLETLDGKSDSFAVRPGSPEAEAVLAYANQGLPDNAAGTAFLNQLDATMHKTAAKNIAKFRAGADGNFGTPDDKTFADLTALDKVPYVGRTALMQLLGLADAAGFLTRASVDCFDYIPSDRGNYTIRSYAALLEIENSRCTTINGNLTIQISGTDILPPSAREIQALQHLESVTGNLTIYATPIFNSINFKSLKKVDGSLTATYNTATPMHTLEFPSLTSAPFIQLKGIKKNTFSALETGTQIVLEDNAMEGFTALKTANLLSMRVANKGSYNVDFPVLTETASLDFTYQPSSSYGSGNAEFSGAFPKLAAVTALSMTRGDYANLSFPNLKKVNAGLTTSGTSNAYNGMTKLESVETFSSQNDGFSSGVNSGPKVLQTVGRLSITSPVAVGGYEKLKTVESQVAINATRGISGFNALETVGSSVALTLGGGSGSKIGGFNKLSNLATLTINAQGFAAAVEPGFGALENIEASLSVVNNRAFSTDMQFPKLLSVGGSIRVDQLVGQRDMFPQLEIIDGTLELNYVPTTFIGMNQLTHVEGNVSMAGPMSVLNGLTKLDSIGSNLMVPTGFRGANLDAFLNQLTEFSGTITFRN